MFPLPNSFWDVFVWNGFQTFATALYSTLLRTNAFNNLTQVHSDQDQSDTFRNILEVVAWLEKKNKFDDNRRYFKMNTYSASDTLL